MAEKEFLTPEQRKGLLLGSLASGVLSAIVGARTGGDAISTGLVGASSAYGGGLDHLTRIKKSALDLEAEEERMRASQEGTQLARETLGETKRHRQEVERVNAENILSSIQARGIAGKVQSERESALRIAAKEREQAELGWQGLRGGVGDRSAFEAGYQTPGIAPPPKGMNPDIIGVLEAMLPAQRGEALGKIVAEKTKPSKDVWGEPYEDAGGNLVQKNSETGQVKKSSSIPKEKFPVGTVQNMTGGNKRERVLNEDGDPVWQMIKAPPKEEKETTMMYNETTRHSVKVRRSEIKSYEEQGYARTKPELYGQKPGKGKRSAGSSMGNEPAGPSDQWIADAMRINKMSREEVIKKWKNK